jgi:hypothetical protein
MGAVAGTGAAVDPEANDAANDDAVNDTVEGAAKADTPPPNALAAHSNVAAPATVATLARVPIGASVSLRIRTYRQSNDYGAFP